MNGLSRENILYEELKSSSKNEFPERPPLIKNDFRSVLISAFKEGKMIKKVIRNMAVWLQGWVRSFRILLSGHA
jgi:hypothetical protein